MRHIAHSILSLSLTISLSPSLSLSLSLSHENSEVGFTLNRTRKEDTVHSCINSGDQVNLLYGDILKD